MGTATSWFDKGIFFQGSTIKIGAVYARYKKYAKEAE